jgi:hypothetical protein
VSILHRVIGVVSAQTIFIETKERKKSLSVNFISFQRITKGDEGTATIDANLQ